MTECSKTVGDRLVSAMSSLGVDHVFTLPSANIEPLLRCVTAGPLTPIVAANELSAGFMADGYAHVRGTPGVAVVGGGIASIYTLPARLQICSPPGRSPSGEIVRGPSLRGQRQNSCVP